MDIFNILALLGGLSLFLFGMSIMGSSLEKRAGDSLKSLLGKLTSGKLAGFLTGLAVTAVIQSSSATTVMVVGFVNSGIMTLRQAINVIMGANVGTTVTAWLLSLSGIDGSSLLIQLLKPTSFTPVLALIGIILYMIGKEGKKKDTGMILLGFATLMFGMDAMSDAVSGLRDVPEFRNILLLFQNPILGVLAGAVLTAIIQSSSASVGILQALASTGQVTFGAAIPIIMGQNIGTCVTAMLSSVGTNKNGRRAAIVHLSFNIIGTALCLVLFTIARSLLHLPLFEESASEFGIAVAHTAFNVICTAALFPATKLLEKLAYLFIPETPVQESTQIELDERLMASPSMALERCREVSVDMARTALDALRDSIGLLDHYDAQIAQSIRDRESQTDHYEDVLGTYLVKLSTHPLSARSHAESAQLLHVIGDFERISDHAVNLAEAAEEIREKGLQFTGSAQKELNTLCGAVQEILQLAQTAFIADDVKTASLVEPLEEVIDVLKEQLRARHIVRLQAGTCSLDAGFVWSDLLTNLERVADHCSNIAGCIIETHHGSLGMHNYLGNLKAGTPEYLQEFNNFTAKYALESAQ